ncbi:hypothetical protein E2562_013039 [Oryza meyeriana var. granulata]|uniref:Uncharacterized protein n=1 Tax=Oryza meyeriana var. granulata TaxID=110450 RepID=A0A6G1DIA6_9ORYZ|nr:hypothetical protein E2562_013039 [Oryza meyeriana var. granulata]
MATAEDGAQENPCGSLTVSRGSGGIVRRWCMRGRRRWGRAVALAHGCHCFPFSSSSYKWSSEGDGRKGELRGGGVPSSESSRRG